MASLIEQDRYLRDPQTREKSLHMAAASSSAVVGIHKPFAAAKTAERKSTVTPNHRKRTKSA